MSAARGISKIDLTGKNETQDRLGGSLRLRNMRLWVKLVMLCGIFMLSTAAVSWLGVTKLSDMNAKLEYGRDLSQQLLITGKINQELMDIMSYEKNFIVEYDPNNSFRWWGKRDGMDDKLKTDVAKAKSISNEEEKKIWDDFMAKYELYSVGVANVFTVMNDLDLGVITSNATTPEAKKMRESYLKAIHISVDDNSKLRIDAQSILKTLDERFRKQWDIAADEGAKAYKKAKLQLAVTIVAGLAAAVFVAFLIVKALTKAVKNTNNVIKEIAAGDFTREVPVEGRDEIGELGKSINEMISGLRKMFQEISGTSKTLAGSADGLATISTQLATSSNDMTMQATSVATTTEQMSHNIVSMASGIEETSVNAFGVASTAGQMSSSMTAIANAVDMMSSSINHIAQNTNETSKVAKEAMKMSKTAGETMQSLGQAAREIGKVTEMIKRIAEQTNLLALNATIEAASAGDAGKGFAVVANEIKELANQSARAAEEIAAKIGGVQGSSTNAMKVITDVSEVIGRINQAVAVITEAVSDQTAAANKISKNVGEATRGANNIAMAIAEVAKGAGDMSRNAGEAAKGANEVSTNIVGITRSAEENNDRIVQINSSSGELAKISGQLQDLVSKFKVEATDDEGLIKA